MTLRERWQHWRSDRLLGKILKNTGYLFSCNTLAMLLGMVQSIFAARLLGVEGFGVIGTVTVFASTINRLFSFRMGDLTVKYLGEYVTRGEKDKAGALVKVAALTEAVTSLLAFAVLVILAPLAALFFAKDPNTRIWFVIYGLSILGLAFSEVSLGVLQVFNRFRGQAAINLAQSILTAVMIFVAYFTHAGMGMVVAAYLIGKVLLGVGPAVLALHTLRRDLSPDWWRADTRSLPPWRELAGFGLNTNFSATLNLLVRDTEVLWISFLLNPLSAGYYKVAQAVINLILMPINPFITTTFPEIAKAAAAKAWSALRRILRRITLISGVWMVGVVVGLALFGRWVLLLYGAEYQPAYPVLMILVIGYGIANIFFWNRNLLLSFNLSGYALQAALWPGLAKVALVILLVPQYGVLMQAGLLSAYFIISQGVITLRGLQELHRQSALEPEGTA